ncbi:MAG: MFS transporter [Massilibacteroides sp.]|nr:MFS transporter [Massilibacteroides sp.]MDD3062682.1 MFS transporter [Massilibacteroides sp.]MDD4114738.1 MFS transporter [Massilibacteroides sp.]MDD4660175.1 MFS transporter [Massilibacteroides sp.]
MKKNLLALYIIKFSKWFSFVMPVIVLFYEKNGLSLQDIFILKSIYSIVAVAFEIPSGYLADTWGKKNCLILGSILFFGGYLTYSFTETFLTFVFAEVLLSIGQTFVNGADSALLYNTVANYKKNELYLHYEGKLTMIGNFSEAIAGVLGGLLAFYSLRLPFYAQAVIAFSGIPAALALTEYGGKTAQTNALSEVVRIIKYSLFTNKQLAYNIVFSGIIGAATLTMAWFVQPVLIQLETPVSYFGIIWTVLNLAVGISAFYSEKIENYFGETKMNMLILLFISGGYILLAFNLMSYSLLVILLLFYLVRGFATPILKGYINQLTLSEMRTTVLSIRNFIIRLLFAFISPIAGWISDYYSIKTALLFIAFCIVIPGISIYFLNRKRHK